VGARASRHVRVSGGDINFAYCVDFTDRRRVFVKTNEQAPQGMFEAEAHGLEWLRAAHAISVPQVIAVGQAGQTAFLVLEWVEPGRHRSSSDELLGQGLAALHRFGAECFGLDRDNFVGRLLQRNPRCAGFAKFFVQNRLLAQFIQARDAGYFNASVSARFHGLLDRVEVLLGPQEPPARLHGDLWSGNHLVGHEGRPWLIDPAVYGGHREIDLAMMRLFGGFSERVFAAYHEVYPLAPGHQSRLLLMQMYPLLVHVNLFGAGYVAQVERIIDTYMR
jgi:fructosamine-3-kinase